MLRTQGCYDAENRLISTAGVTYTYDGDGNRVEKSSGTLYWGPGPLAESNLTASSTSWKEYVFFSGRRVARRDASNSSVHYYFSDQLGSTSIVANATGGIEDESDYYPYGGERVVTASVPQNYKFTGKERDGESGLDNFGARYYTSSLGRFMTPDWAARPTTVPYASFGDPQTLNLYTYVENAPVNRADADGHGADCINSNNIRGCESTGEEGDGSQAPAQEDQKKEKADTATDAAKAAAQKPNPPTAAEKKAAHTAQRHAIAQRIALGIRGVLDAKVGVDKISAAAVAGVSTPVTGPLGAFAAAYAGISGTGQVVQGGAEILGAITGKVKGANDASDAIAASTTIGGILGTVISNGDVKTGAAWAQVEQLGTGALKREIFTNLIDNGLAALDLVTSGGEK